LRTPARPPAIARRGIARLGPQRIGSGKSWHEHIEAAPALEPDTRQYPIAPGALASLTAFHKQKAQGKKYSTLSLQAEKPRLPLPNAAFLALAPTTDDPRSMIAN